MSSTVMASAPRWNIWSKAGDRSLSRELEGTPCCTWDNRGSAECFWGGEGKPLGETLLG